MGNRNACFWDDPFYPVLHPLYALNTVVNEEDLPAAFNFPDDGLPHHLWIVCPNMGNNR